MGFGTTKDSIRLGRLLASDELKKRFEHYCASIFSTELPIYDRMQAVLCPRPQCNGSLRPLPLSKKFKHILKQNVAAPNVVKCIVCHAEVCEYEIVSAYMEREWAALDENHQVISSPSAVEAIRHKFGGLSTDKATANVQLSRLLLKGQLHAYTHTRSYIEGRFGTKCRYKFFRKLDHATGFNSTNEMVYRRRISNQWLNPYIPLWTRFFHFNMDARLLWSGHGLQITRYALQIQNAVKRRRSLTT